jgi:acylphosphatase
MKKRIECTVTGRVQLVMYRDFSQRKARKLSITGWVMNKKDGSVFVVAEGDESALLSYIEYLKKGSILSRVENVSVLWKEDCSGEYKDFRIMYY